MVVLKFIHSFPLALNKSSLVLLLFIFLPFFSWKLRGDPNHLLNRVLNFDQKPSFLNPPFKDSSKIHSFIPAFLFWILKIQFVLYITWRFDGFFCHFLFKIVWVNQNIRETYWIGFKAWGLLNFDQKRSFLNPPFKV